MTFLKRALVACAVFCVITQAFAAPKEDALVLYRQGNYARAIKVCEQEIAANANNPTQLVDSYCVLCWSLIRNRQYAEAEQRANDARKINANDMRIIEALGEARFYQGKNSAALEMFQLYVANAPMNASDYGWSYYYMGEIYVRQERFEHADIAHSMAVHVNPQKALFWARCGYAREMTKSYQSAIDAYTKALALDSTQTDAARGKERCQARLR